MPHPYTDISAPTPADPERLRPFTDRLLRLPQHDLQLLASVTDTITADKGAMLIAAGEVSRRMLLVERGLIRQFYYKGGHDITEHFAREGDLVYCIESLFTRRHTSLMAEALESTVVHRISYEGLVALFERSFPLASLYRLFLEADLIISQRKADSLRFESARERYDNFVKRHPDIARRAPLYHIASYLLMTPESLSRIRAGAL